MFLTYLFWSHQLLACYWHRMVRQSGNWIESRAMSRMSRPLAYLLAGKEVTWRLTGGLMKKTEGLLSIGPLMMRKEKSSAVESRMWSSYSSSCKWRNRSFPSVAARDLLKYIMHKLITRYSYFAKRKIVSRSLEFLQEIN